METILPAYKTVGSRRYRETSGGWDKVKASHPVFAGDTLYAESTVLHKRESKSRPTQGIVTVQTRGINQDGAEVMSFERTMLVHRRGHSPEEAANY
jgi:itaconyl-CoA hydratase